jgi:hypothetical protein
VVAKSLLAKILLRVILPLAVILVIVLGVSYFGFKQVGGIGLFEGMRIEKDVKQVISEFMEAGEARNIEAAYACWSPESITRGEIVEFIGRRYVFAGYESLTIDNMSWETRWGEIRPEVVAPQGDGESDGDGGGIKIYKVQGEITYTGKRARRFQAWMGPENDGWKIKDITIGGASVIRSNYLR